MPDNDKTTALVAIIDTETTGLTDADEPISIGIATFEVELPKGVLIRKVDTYYGLREPDVPIHPRAQKVHGISIDAVVGRDFDYKRIDEVLAPCEFVVAHHAEFDARMLVGLIPLIRDKSWRCSMHSIHWVRFVNLPNRKLDTICAHFGVARPTPHNALHDCEALADVLFRHTGKTTRSRTFVGEALSWKDWGIRWERPTASKRQGFETSITVSVPVSSVPAPTVRSPAVQAPEISSAEIRDMVEDGWRQFLVFAARGDQKRGADAIAELDASVARHASAMSAPAASVFRAAVEQERDKLFNEYQSSPDALKRRLGIEANGRPLPAHSPSRPEPGQSFFNAGIWAFVIFIVVATVLAFAWR